MCRCMARSSAKSGIGGSVLCSPTILDSEPEIVKVKKDEKDYVEYGGVIPAQAGFLKTNGILSPKNILSLQEYRASQFDFGATKPHWTNRTVADEPMYGTLSNGFKKVFESVRISMSE